MFGSSASRHGNVYPKEVMSPGMKKLNLLWHTYTHILHFVQQICSPSLKKNILPSLWMLKTNKHHIRGQPFAPLAPETSKEIQAAFLVL